MDWKKELIDDAIVKVATNDLKHVLRGTSNMDIRYRALDLYENCSKILGYVVMGYWAKALTDEEYKEYHSFVYDMVIDARCLALFGRFI